jgi:hypothetical protein
MSFFLGNPIQQRLFHLMRHAYQLCTLCDEPELLDIALWLAQSDNLHLLQWFEEWARRPVSACFAGRWWGINGERLLSELRRLHQLRAGRVGAARRSLRASGRRSRIARWWARWVPAAVLAGLRIRGAGHLLSRPDDRDPDGASFAGRYRDHRQKVTVRGRLLRHWPSRRNGKNRMDLKPARERFRWFLRVILRQAEPDRVPLEFIDGRS